MLKILQAELPKLWTNELYSEIFNGSPSPYKDFDHALKHVRKAVQQLENMTEEADHCSDIKNVLEHFKHEAVEKYLADLVICTVRLALKSPTGPIDMEKAIRDRIQKKMGATLPAQ